MVGSLSDAQIELYSRQILLPEIGGIGQKRLLGASCGLVGRGPGLALAASYLVGAGIGRLFLPGGGATGLDLGPRLEERGPDTQIVDGLPGSLDELDALLLVADAAPLVAALAGRPRYGELLLACGTRGDASLVVIPAAAAGCTLCTIARRPEALASLPTGPEPAAGVPEWAGALAALAICRWLIGLAPETAPSALCLAPSAPTWEPARVERILPCPRGCRS